MGSILFLVYVLFANELLLGGEKVKNPKVLKRRHKIFLEGLGLNPDDFLVERESAYDYVFYNKKTGKLITIRR